MRIFSKLMMTDWKPPPRESNAISGDLDASRISNLETGFTSSDRKRNRISEMDVDDAASAPLSFFDKLRASRQGDLFSPQDYVEVDVEQVARQHAANARVRVSVQMNRQSEGWLACFSVKPALYYSACVCAP